MCYSSVTCSYSHPRTDYIVVVLRGCGGGVGPPVRCVQVWHWASGMERGLGRLYEPQKVVMCCQTLSYSRFGASQMWCRSLAVVLGLRILCRCGTGSLGVAGATQQL